MADNTILNTGSGGDTIASDDIGGIKFQRIKLIYGADGVNSGDVSSTNGFPVNQTEEQTWQWIVPSTAVGANKVFLDMFNAVGSGSVIRICSICPIVDTDVAVVGALGIRIILVKTSTVGTGGTAWQLNGAVDVAGGSRMALDSANTALSANITGRHLTTGGATNAGWLRGAYIIGEETATSQAYQFQGQFNMADTTMGCQKITLREGEGIKLLQGAVAATGNVRFRIVFTVE